MIKVNQIETKQTETWEKTFFLLQCMFFICSKLQTTKYSLTWVSSTSSHMKTVIVGFSTLIQRGHKFCSCLNNPCQQIDPIAVGL